MKNKQPYLRWLDQAKNDFNWTQSNIKEKIYYGACFTSQQSAEKSLKSYLLKQNLILPKIHDLIVLLEKSIEFDSSFEQLREACAGLTDYYIETRYPDVFEFFEFDKTQALEAYKNAETILRFVEKKIVE